MSGFSKTRIDRLGERLREGAPSDDDLRLLDDYRCGFKAVFEEAQRRLRVDVIAGEISGRAAKTTISIIQKLRRQQTRHVRLSQMQDICGLRVVVATLADQDQVVRRVVKTFPESSIDDRRTTPSNGYRALHVIVTLSGLPVEIQIRTTLQHMWAQFCEHLADKLGGEVKYGGHPAAQKLLDTFSEAIRNLEDTEGADMVRENPYTVPVARQDFVASFRSLICFVAQEPRGVTQEANDVLPH